MVNHSHQQNSIGSNQSFMSKSQRHASKRIDHPFSYDGQIINPRFRWFNHAPCVRAVPPSKPVILDGTTRDISRLEEPYNEGSDVNLICEVRGGRPPPKLTWYLENTVIDESYHYNTESGLTVNRLSYPKVGRQHLKARLICEASNTNLVIPQTRLVILDVNRKFLILYAWFLFISIVGSTARKFSLAKSVDPISSTLYSLLV